VIQTENSFSDKLSGNKVRLAAGHTTSQSPAPDFLCRVIEFCEGIVSGSVPQFVKIPGDVVAPAGSLGDEMFVSWQGEGRTEFSLVAWHQRNLYETSEELVLGTNQRCTNELR
jgi:hypothetical protein